ncbi:MAG: TonB-dependent receptor plug domain-containing protein [Bacteroidales bacterium]|nr:TonB-dependent receptor plug domain-containing protein [Bacteroidales bacterium]
MIKLIKPYNLKIIVFVIFTLSGNISPMFAQTAVVSGIVEDAGSGEKLIGAGIYNDDKTHGTVSNNYGFFSLTVPAGLTTLHFSYLGYKETVVTANLQKDTSFHIKLVPSLLLEEVTISSDYLLKNIHSSQTGLIELPVKSLITLPYIMGESDLLKAIQLMPGIQSGGEASSGIYVRGGSPDQNLFLLDGVPVYNVNHLFGFVSVFNTSAIRNVSVLKGGFPARYGGRLSSVIDIRMKEGNNKEFHGEGSIGVVASKISLEGPIIKDKTSFIVSARRSYLDVLAQPVVKAIDDFATVRYYLYDANAKINHQVNKNNRIFLSLYLGDDVGFYRYNDKYIYDEIKYTRQDKTGIQWGNITTALRWNSIISNRLFANTTLTCSRYRFKLYDTDKKTTEPARPSINSRYSWTYLSGVTDYSVKSEFDYAPSPGHYIRFGGSYTYHDFNPGTNEYHYQGADYADMVDKQFGTASITASEISFYIEDDFDLAERLKVNAGAHASSFFVRSEKYYSLQPRISARYLFAKNLSVKGSVANMVQYIHLLTNSSVSLPTDLWLPATDQVKPENSWQYSASVAFPVKNTLVVTTEVFYKTLNNIIEYQDGQTYLNSNADWETIVETGKGWSYGLEWLIEKREGKTTGWLGYTLAWSNRQFTAINKGEVFPFKYDRRHDISLAIIHKLSEKLDIGLVWVFGSGTALTLPAQKFISALPLFNPQESTYYWEHSVNQEIEYIKSRNSFRMPSYHRLDLSFNFHKPLKWGERTLSLGLYNAYSRNNPFYIYIGQNYDWYGMGSGEPVVKKVSLFPVIPFISYNFRF